MSRLAQRLAIVGLAVALFAGRAAADTYAPPTSFYSDAVATDSALLGQLRTIVSTMTPVNYGDARYSAQYTDPDPNFAGNILLIYNRASVSGVWSTNPLVWNREHIWPQSRLGASASNSVANIASDQFNLRPADEGINNARGNKPFGLDTTSGGHSSQGAYYYPGDADAGDVARSQFYMATRWSALSLTDDTLPETGGLRMGDLSSLINYHFKDVPDTFERRRNHAIYGLAGENSPAIDNPYKQSNRNPYVDHPEWVWPIFKTTANTSQISIAGGTEGGDGDWTRNIDLGRVFVGAAVPSSQDFTLNRAGLDGTYFEVTTSGVATSSLSGRFNAFKNEEVDSKSITVGLDTSTGSAGLKSGTVSINNLDVTTTGGAGRGANDANDLFDVSLTVLNHATPSFDGGFDEPVLLHDFGSIMQGSAAPVHNFSVFNFGINPAFTANLDFDSVVVTGDSSMLTTNLASAAGSLSLVGGASQGFTATFGTTTPGEFSATYTLSFSDEDIAGALIDTLTLTLVGEVLPELLAGDYNRDHFVDAADFTVWRDSYGASVAEFEGADGDGDMLVDDDDFQVWKDNFGAFEGSGSGSLGSSGRTVPEPATWLLVVMASVLLATRNRSARPGSSGCRAAG